MLSPLLAFVFLEREPTLRPLLLLMDPTWRGGVRLEVLLDEAAPRRERFEERGFSD